MMTKNSKLQTTVRLYVIMLWCDFEVDNFNNLIKNESFYALLNRLVDLLLARQFISDALETSENLSSEFMNSCFEVNFKIVLKLISLS